MKDMDETIKKLWELLEAHNKQIGVVLLQQRVAFQDKDIDAVGEFAGQIVVISQSSVCYATAIEILEELKISKS